ncbi:3-hydroxybutyryl-CoA dehydrogenase [Stackebrandtia endophytica]|uniref:3-hydroxybutyryl-CoA dehydrogenase n=1 Tax=Stackebrandtia endophytica TaxID=1496996 RepID=A0A543AZ78_9ACTN|nr:3-hydroxyacyl-CoA dehydrogenase family protein [Stackebrandtia endophytica]TQL77887.1 3-hydroxybutyryl-CoA dehydrogenase [Stackebrandtia endophytica]
MSEQFVVIGGGTMGAGIAYVAALADYQVTLCEVDGERAASALDRIGRWAEAAEDRGRAEPGTATRIRSQVSTVTNVTDAPEAAEVIVEAVPERLDLKRRILTAAQQRSPKLLASNTSSISISEIAESLEAPERFIGLHFFNPVYAMALLEIVTGDRTSPQTTQAALDIARRLGKQPIVVEDAPGFATSRLGNALGLEAIRMVESGVASAADIDTAMSLGYRHPLGPLELTDVVGLDVRLDIARTLQEAYGDRFAPPQLLIDMVAAGKLGKKTGEGFYRWHGGQKVV